MRVNRLSFVQKTKILKYLEEKKDVIETERPSKQQVTKWVRRDLGIDLAAPTLASVAAALEWDWPRPAASDNLRSPRYGELVQRVKDLEERLASLEHELGKTN